jgi:hypothetical protein
MTRSVAAARAASATSSGECFLANVRQGARDDLSDEDAVQLRDFAGLSRLDGMGRSRGRHFPSIVGSGSRTVFTWPLTTCASSADLRAETDPRRTLTWCSVLSAESWSSRSTREVGS